MRKRVVLMRTVVPSLMVVGGVPWSATIVDSPAGHSR
jgi:hypothetical protein